MSHAAISMTSAVTSGVTLFDQSDFQPRLTDVGRVLVGQANAVLAGAARFEARVAAFIRAWRANRQVQEQTTGRGTFVPLVFMPDEAFQFDWSED